MRRVLVSLLTLLLVAPALPARAAGADPLPPRVAATTSDGVLAVSIRFPKVLLQPGEGTLVEAAVRNVSKEPVAVVRANSCSSGVVVVADGPGGQAFALAHQGHPHEICLQVLTTAQLAPGESVHATFEWDGSQATGVYHFRAVGVRSQPQGDPVRVSAELPVRVGDFNDMGGHWAADLVRRGAELGLASGYPDGGFHPDQPVSEGEFIKLLDRAVGLQPMGSGGEHWAAPWVRAAWIAGIVDDPHLSLDLPALRLQVVTWAARATGVSPSAGSKAASNFPDLDGLTADQRGYVGVLHEMGVVYGSMGELHPLLEATRAEVLTMLVRLHDYLAPHPDATAQVSVGGKPVTAKVLAATPLLPELVQAGPVATALGAPLAPQPDGTWSLMWRNKLLEVLPGSPLALVHLSTADRCMVERWLCPAEPAGGYVSLGRPVVVLDDDLYLPASAFTALGAQVRVSHPTAAQPGP